MTRTPHYISQAEAQTMSGKRSRWSLRRWIRQWNEANPDKPVLCISGGRIEEYSLIRALGAHAEQCTPGFNAARAQEALGLMPKRRRVA